MQQVDDFAISAPSKRIVNHVLDLINDLLFIPTNYQGLLTLYNGLDILQTKTTSRSLARLTLTE
jgi:hypothetical protein